MKMYAISNRYGKDSIMVCEGVYSSKEAAKKRAMELAINERQRIANRQLMHDGEVDVTVAEDWTGIIWIKWDNGRHSNIFEVIELEVK